MFYLPKANAAAIINNFMISVVVVIEGIMWLLSLFTNQMSFEARAATKNHVMVVSQEKCFRVLTPPIG